MYVKKQQLERRQSVLIHLPKPNLSRIIKGILISKCILTLDTLPTKSAKSLSWAESLNFPPFTLNNLFKFSAQGRELGLL